MISLSEEWARLSRIIYGEKFIDELFGLLKKNNVKTFLECGCGDGNIACGLAKRGLIGIAIDSDPEMIKLARKNNSHPNLKYKLMNWLEINKIKMTFDCIICRGNSLSCINSWGKKTDISNIKILESVEKFFKKLSPNGLLYLDCISEKQKIKSKVNIKEGDFHLKGKIFNDFDNLIRFTEGKGYLGNEHFNICSKGYLLLTPELKKMIKIFKPKKIWMPKLKFEKNYEVICVKK